MDKRSRTIIVYISIVVVAGVATLAVYKLEGSSVMATILSAGIGGLIAAIAVLKKWV